MLGGRQSSPSLPAPLAANFTAKRRACIGGGAIRSAPLLRVDWKQTDVSTLGVDSHISSAVLAKQSRQCSFALSLSHHSSSGHMLGLVIFIHSSPTHTVANAVLDAAKRSHPFMHTVCKGPPAHQVELLVDIATHLQESRPRTTQQLSAEHSCRDHPRVPVRPSHGHAPSVAAWLLHCRQTSPYQPVAQQQR